MIFTATNNNDFCQTITQYIPVVTYNGFDTTAEQLINFQRQHFSVLKRTCIT